MRAFTHNGDQLLVRKFDAYLETMGNDESKQMSKIPATLM